MFQHPVPASAFASKSFSDEFFRTQRCFRYNQTLCAKPGSPWYEVSHSTHLASLACVACNQS